MSADANLPQQTPRKYAKRPPRPQRAACLTPLEQTQRAGAGVNTPQPLVYTRLDGTEMRFAGVSAFVAFWLVEQRHKKQERANA